MKSNKIPNAVYLFFPADTTDMQQQPSRRSMSARFQYFTRGQSENATYSASAQALVEVAMDCIFVPRTGFVSHNIMC